MVDYVNINFTGSVDPDILIACHVNIKGLVDLPTQVLATNCLAKML